MENNSNAVIEVRELALSYDEHEVMRGLNFCVDKGKIFVVMGTSGCGKTTLLRSMIGLKEPKEGQVLFDGKDFWADPSAQAALMRDFGVLYQGGALWSSFTLAENIALPLEFYTALSKEQIRQIAELKLALVGLGGYGDFYPSEISGGMRKRAGLARAIALDPKVIFFDEPSAGLDPVNARMLDQLILQIRDALGATIVVVTHELASIFSVADDSILLDSQEKTMIAQGSPKYLLDHSTDPRVRRFLTRGEG